LRGYYATTYTRSYGPRQGYIHLDSYPSADFERRRSAAMNADGNQVGDENGELGTQLDSQATRDENCLRCEQLARSNKESSGCLRCLQLAAV